MQLTSANVNAVLRDCLFKGEEVPDMNNPPPHVPVNGIMMNLAFHPERLESHREDVRSMLAQLDDAFMHDKGGGMSLLNMCVTKDGEQYGEHRDADALYMLANGLGLAKFTMPREMWSILPGAVPYITVTL